jgi:hypothetical protein
MVGWSRTKWLELEVYIDLDKYEHWVFGMC